MTPSTTDMVTQLTRPHRHAEAYTHEANGTTYTQRHNVTVPALLDQLQHPTPLTGGEHGGSGYGSRPAASIEALDTLIRIDLEAARWVRDLGLDDPGDTAACVRLAGSLVPQTTSCTTPTNERRSGCCLTHDIARWWHQARIVSGWDVAAWKPDNTCPLCGKRGTLRVRLADLAALCTDCRSTWDSTTISLLSGHIRAENHDEDDTQI